MIHCTIHNNIKLLFLSINIDQAEKITGMPLSGMFVYKQTNRSVQLKEKFVRNIGLGTKNML